MTASTITADYALLIDTLERECAAVIGATPCSYLLFKSINSPFVK